MMGNRILEVDPWRIVERGFDPQDGRSCMASESLFSIGNGAMGGRANFEEYFSGKSLQGNYIGGVYYPDKTRVGWWKNGYPEYFAKVLNSAFWPGIDLVIGGERLDLAAPAVAVEDFYRELDMRRGLLTRTFVATLTNGVQIRVEAKRFVSMADFQLGAVSYRLTLQAAPQPGGVQVCMTAFVDGDVRNEDANYDDKFWELVSLGADNRTLTMRTKKTGFEVCWAQRCTFSPDSLGAVCKNTSSGERVGECYTVDLAVGQDITLYKFVGVASSLNHAAADLATAASTVADNACGQGFEAIRQAHEQAWQEKWEGCNVAIGGDDSAQQGIRFCIFQLLQTYTGRDDRLNVGPKGFTGEKYGGSTYWDTEAYCLPFYLATCGEQVARQLLLYRYHQLPQAIENGRKLGFKDGAALYPMVTMTGEECHNEWEITFEEIHRNGAIAYAIYNFCRYTGTRDYLIQGGLEVLIGIARFWAQRATFSTAKGRYVILGVTGPNEYENNVNNNWYTNYLAAWCLRYARSAAEYVSVHFAQDYQRIIAKTGLNAASDEFSDWSRVAEGMFLPLCPESTVDEEVVFLQQEGYMDKEQLMAADIPVDQRPINQHWSWDRILRSCFIKQADVLQGLYFFQEFFDGETIARNFDFYEPRTVHESSLSSCVHSILASVVGGGREAKAYELYLRASRLDLDDYNLEVHEGLHITSMAGSWLSVIEGFGGIRIGLDGILHVAPHLPAGWASLAFKLHYRGAILKFDISAATATVSVSSENGKPAEIAIGEQDTLYRIDNKIVTVNLK